MFADVSAISVFLYGLASFLSPCVLPLIPSYILLLAGGGKNKAPLHGGAFVLGFSILFVAMGATAGSIGRFLMDHRLLLTRVCGGILIFFGILQIFSILLPALQRERRFDFSALLTKNSGPFFALLAGMGFALGWTPCIGPYLTASLLMAASSQTMWRGVFLLFVYSMGLGIPFLLGALLIGSLQKFLPVLRRWMPRVQKISGVLLLLIGIFMLTDAFGFLARI